MKYSTICKHRDHKNTSVLVEEACWKCSENILEELGKPCVVPSVMAFEILDAFENPDGDGYDINHNGVIEENEAFVNWLEYNIRDDLFDGNMTLLNHFLLYVKCLLIEIY